MLILLGLFISSRAPDYHFRLLYNALSHMASRYFVLFSTMLTILLMSPLSAASDPETMVSDIARAIERGSSRDMARFFGNNVDLSLPRAEGTFSKSQSEMILRDFFSRNRPKSFTIGHQDSMRDGSIYVIGTFTTRSGRTYRCYFLIKEVSQSHVLHHIQFELR